jgi:hypothetical protein
VGGFRRSIFIYCQNTEYDVDTEILRIYEKHQNYRYAKKTQISLDPKKCRYVGYIRF